ncbi:MAG TPA: tyrosine-protein phosphatase [Sphingobium sp.]|uniref:tyrosine-protein phosphatase n=1 Tax=Sphingobium sp. TaxID=1912891 RepID=UPI002ED41500
MTMKAAATTIAILLSATMLATPASALVSGASAERDAAGQVILHWTAKAPVDVLQADTADTNTGSAKLVSKGDRDGTATVKADPLKRPYFLLKDTSDGSVTRVAERLVPLKQGSNFRDIGGYPGADGKHVRWGLIYRSGATAMLTPEDVATVNALGLKQLIDLRSDEERVLAPTKIDGVTYTAYGYSMQRIFESMKGQAGSPQNGGSLYRGLPVMLAPQMKLLFAALLSKQGPVEYNCSAGQDRTGFATAMILSALGTPRDVILKDYHLSTGYRQPQWEMPPIDVAAHPNDPVAQMFSHMAGSHQKAQPLMDANGKAFLSSAFEEIDAKWGSTEAYLQQVVGLTPVDIAALRATYLE